MSKPAEPAAQQGRGADPQAMTAVPVQGPQPVPGGPQAQQPAAAVVTGPRPVPPAGPGPTPGPGPGPGPAPGPGLAAGPGPGPRPGPAPAPHAQGPAARPAPSVQAPPARPALPPVAPPVPRARPRLRHLAVVLSFLVAVGLPSGLTATYLWTMAADQYASTVGFSVRREDVSSPIEILGGISALSGSSSSDTDILYEYIQSQKLVSEIDAEIDLRSLWSKPEGDVIFAYDAPGTIEDLVEYWSRMVDLSYDSGAGLIEVKVRAFAAADATLIAEKLFEKSSDMINELTSIAREDAIRYAREELDSALERLKQARETVTRFRNRNQLVDPTLDLQSQAGLLGSLEAQLAAALIEVDLLRDTVSGSNDPRLIQEERRVRVIQERIDAERRKLGIGDQADAAEAFADLVGEYERLVVDREFAETAYTSALAAFDAARGEARRKSRYLAAYMQPTEAESARYPQRGTLWVLISLFLFLGWSILTLVFYSLRDRR